MNKKDIQKKFPHFSIDPETCRDYGVDWSKAFTPKPLGVFFPESEKEICAFLKFCTKNRIAVVPSGGRTGLSGGAVAAKGEVVLSLCKLNRVLHFDAASATARVQAGVITQALHEFLAPHGFTWPVDFASKGSSHIGGNISTNAGGVRVIRYGNTREWVLGLRVVTMDGTVLELDQELYKSNLGLDLKQLFIGSEGILGVITEATLRLAKLLTDSQVLLFSVASLKQALLLLSETRLRCPSTVSAFEYIDPASARLVVETHKLNIPIKDFSHTILLEVESGTDEKLLIWLEKILEEKLVDEAYLAQNRQQAQDFWSLRENVSEAIAIAGPVYKNDISIPIHRLDAFVGMIEKISSRKGPKIATYLFGHLGDGNLHINFPKPKDMSESDFFKICKARDAELFEELARVGGSVSAEHGIGLIKRHALKYSRGKKEITLMKQLKKVLDPKGLLNPGKVL